MQNVLINLLLTYRYFIIIPITIVEGPLIMMISGFLVKLNLFDLVPLYFCLVLGDIIGDIMWYWIGYHFGYRFVQRLGKYFSLDEKSIHIIENFFHKYKYNILIISKLTMGFGFAIVTLFTAGLVKVPFKQYLILNIIGEFIWAAILMGIGYLLGNFYVSVNNVLEKVSIISGIIIVFVILVGIGKYLKAEILTKNP